MSGSNGNGNGKPGRPSKFETCSPLILDAIRNRCTVVSARKAAGVGKTTYETWCREKPGFREAVQRARAEGYNARVSCLMKAAETDWRAALAALEREDPERWSLKQRIEHSVAPKPMGEELDSDATLEALDRMGEALEAESTEQKPSRSRLPSE